MNKIRELRKKNKIPAKDLAGLLNITVRHLYDLEAGKVQLAEDRIKFLCDKFKVTSDYLLGRENKVLSVYGYPSVEEVLMMEKDDPKLSKKLDMLRAMDNSDLAEAIANSTHLDGTPFSEEEKERLIKLSPELAALIKSAIKK